MYSYEYPHVGKDNHQHLNLKTSEYVAMELIKPYLNKGREATCVNFYTSIGFAKELMRNKTNLVGTVHKSRRKIHKEI